MGLCKYRPAILSISDSSFSQQYCHMGFHIIAFITVSTYSHTHIVQRAGVLSIMVKIIHMDYVNLICAHSVRQDYFIYWWVKS